MSTQQSHVVTGQHSRQWHYLSEVFDPRSNSIGFLRWLMAFLVIFSHAGPIGGFYGGEDLGVQISSEQSLGGVAVAGFFFFSGFLITKSRMGHATIFRYFWRRILRIFPAFWTALLFTVVVLAPISYYHEHGNLNGYLHPPKESPLTYFWNNMFLVLNQRNIAGEGGNLPYSVLHGAFDWNGSAWTLKYEFLCYILVGLAGLFGLFTHRRLGGLIALAAIVLNALMWMGVKVTALSPVFSDIFLLMFFAPFAFGTLFALFGDRIPLDGRLALFGICLGVFTYATHGWNIVGQFGFCYFLMWLAVVLPLKNWERFGDFSYGVYIFAWPIMTFGAHFGLPQRGWIVYHLVIIIATHVVAFLSWHLIEKPAMSLKNWTPVWMKILFQKCRRADKNQPPAEVKASPESPKANS